MKKLWAATGLFMFGMLPFAGLLVFMGAARGNTAEIIVGMSAAGVCVVPLIVERCRFEAARR
jgi:hypothetical protein